MPLDYGGLDPHRTPLERLERIQPLSAQRNGYLPFHRIEELRIKFLRTVPDAGSQRLGNRLLGAPEPDKRNLRRRALPSHLKFGRRKHSIRELFGEFARGAFNVNAHTGVGGNHGSHKIAGMGYGQIQLHRKEIGPCAESVRLALVVSPYLNVGRAPAGLVVLVHETAHRLLGRYAPEKPFRPALNGSRHFGEGLALAFAEDYLGYGLEPKRGIALKDAVRNVNDPGGRDGRGRRPHKLRVEGLGEICGRR